jgi:hypothetical protein
VCVTSLRWSCIHCRNMFTLSKALRHLTRPGLETFLHDWRRPPTKAYLDGTLQHWFRQACLTCTCNPKGRRASTRHQSKQGSHLIRVICHLQALVHVKKYPFRALHDTGAHFLQENFHLVERKLAEIVLRQQTVVKDVSKVCCYQCL